ncbi:MAG TPA: hypothetical protein DDY17_09830 [Syntrophaceae bacterium]|nr:hypothetical protein [Syntrophaceae bacterium]
MSKKYGGVYLVDVLLISLLCIIIYAPSLFGNFVYDDIGEIVNNSYIKKLQFIPTYFDPYHKETWSFYEQQHGAYRPLILVSFALNYHLSGLDPFSYHLFNIILHIVNSLLVYLTIGKVLCLSGSACAKEPQNRQIAFASALLFACHPLQTESVSYIVSRTSLLSTSFILGAFLSFIASLSRDRYRITLRLASIMSFAFGLLTKEIVIVLPIIVFIYSILHFHNQKQNKIFISSLRICMPYFFILAAYLLFRIVAVFQFYIPEATGLFIYYFFTSLKAFFIYLKLLIIPVGQNVDHYLPIVKTIWEPSALLAFAGIIIYYGISSPIFFRRSKPLFFFSMWFLIALLPTMVLPTHEPISEHTVYFPSIGFFAAVIIAIVEYWSGSRWSENKTIKIAGLAVFSVIIVLMAYLTMERSRVWNNEISLWSDSVKKSPNHDRPHNNLGLAYMQIGRFDLAIREFQSAVSLNPRNASTLSNIGIAWALSGNYEEAKKAFTESIKIAPLNTDALNNLGFLHIQSGEYGKAIPILEKAIAIKPNDFAANANVGLAYCQTNRRKKGCEYLQGAIHINPDYKRGVLLYQQWCEKKIDDE